MTYKEITDLVKLVNRSDLTELRLKQENFEIQIRTSKFQRKDGTQIIQATPSVMPIQQPAAPAADPATPAPATEKAAPAAEKSADFVAIKSPIVGTFYRSASPEKPPFKKVGDRVEKGDIVCIVEAMKLFNEIESEVSGTIVQVATEDATAVEYDQPLFLIDPS